MLQEVVVYISLVNTLLILGNIIIMIILIKAKVVERNVLYDLAIAGFRKREWDLDELSRHPEKIVNSAEAYLVLDYAMRQVRGISPKIVEEIQQFVREEHSIREIKRYLEKLR